VKVVDSSGEHAISASPGSGATGYEAKLGKPAANFKRWIQKGFRWRQTG
jgi:hypothetical protein